MIRHSTSFYCRRCEQARPFTRRGLDHRKHRLATLLTFGLWGPVWFFLHQRDVRRSWRCCICRGHQHNGLEPSDPGYAALIRRAVTMPAPLASRR